MLMQQTVTQAYLYARTYLGQGAKADYIPQLCKMNSDYFGLAITNLAGQTYGCGDFEQKFTIQSICKVILLITALQDAGFDKVFSRVGMEPTGDKFNSIVRLETGSGNRPLNPLINAGAIAVTSCIAGSTSDDKFDRVLHVAQTLLGNQAISYDEDVYSSEKATGDRNRALAYMMRSGGVFSESVDELLETYFKACSLSVNCSEISYMGAILANNGVDPISGKLTVDPFFVKVTRSLMSVCGLYDASGEFALRVGIPAKSGVGGGILGIVPSRMGIATFAPLLDSKGNSTCGIKAMEFLSSALSLSIF